MLRRDWIRPRRVTRDAALSGIPAPAKLNLGLAVTGRRTDGYHKLVTLMTTLNLADTVRIEPAAAFSLTCDDATLETEDNLVLRAARALQAATGETRAARITLTKRIPVAAGLGGGSSDAAATLIALDALWGTATPDDVLLDLARALGADVPFALYGGAMMARGIGDVLTSATVPAQWLVLIVPRVEIPRKTNILYAALTEADYGVGTAISRHAAALRQGIGIDPMLLNNSFLAPLERIAPIVTETRTVLAAQGYASFLSGSGPTLYLLCNSEADANNRAIRIDRMTDAMVTVTRIAAWADYANETIGTVASRETFD